MKRILLIDDDKITHQLVKRSLQDVFALSSVFTLEEARQELFKTSQFDLIILDRFLPDGDGLVFCNQLRENERFSGIPLIILSSADQETDKVTGLFAGADDYITKPFSVLEFKARIHARLRHATRALLLGDLSFDVDAGRVYRGFGEAKREIELTRYEYKILYALSQAPDRVFTRQQILDKVWGDALNVNDRVVDAHISHLRKKIESSQIKLESLRGEGYRLTLCQIRQASAA